jgi:small subunit ribosomal protein S1
LSHKHLEENPWDTFETIFAVGSLHKCTVVGKGDKIATLELPYGIEGVCALKNLAKEDGTIVEVGESVDFKVTEFSKDEKRIALSHAKTWQEKDEPKVEEKAKPAKAEKAKESDKAATLGDISALSALKEQMEEGEKKKKVAASKKVKEAQAE